MGIKIDTSAARKTAQESHETAAKAKAQADAVIAATNAAAERIAAIPPTKDMKALDAAMAAAIRGNN